MRGTNLDPLNCSVCGALIGYFDAEEISIHTDDEISCTRGECIEQISR